MRIRFIAQCLFLSVLIGGLSFSWLPMASVHVGNYKLAVTDGEKTSVINTTSTTGRIIQAEKQGTEIPSDKSLGKPAKITVAHPTWLKATAILLALVSLAGGALLLRGPR
ncbi:MAG TPA: hypothetical protein VE439_07830 [Anaerolineae bacterium]|nr:hypothetical protein [Anaerolineae bacterium]